MLLGLGKYSNVVGQRNNDSFLEIDERGKSVAYFCPRSFHRHLLVIKSYLSHALASTHAPLTPSSLSVSFPALLTVQII